jgi:PAPA-1-like conserved region
MDTINRLLNKQEPKRRRKVLNGMEMDEDGLEYRAPAAFIRYVHTVDGSNLMVPDGWVESPAGEIFTHSIKPLKRQPPFSGRMVEEIS